MEPTKFFSKGYGKVNNPSESHQESISYSTNNHPRRRRMVLAAVSFAIFLTVLIAVMVIALVHESSTESPEEDEGHPSKSSPSLSSISSNPVESLKIVCSVTQHPDSCISSISSLNNNNNNIPPKADPVHFFNLSLTFSFQEVQNLSSLPKELIPKANDKRIESALQDCLSLFENSVSQLNESAALMKVSPGEKVFTEMKISNLQTWISAAMTDEETCLDGLEEIGGVSATVGDEVKMKVHKSQEYMSNSLAILNNLQSLLGKFGLTMP